MRTQLSWYQTFINTDPSALPPVPQRAPRQAPHAPAPPAASPSDRAPPFSAPQPPSSLYSTVPEPSGPYPPYTGPQAVYHEHGHAVPLQPQTSGEGRVLGRIVAAFLAIGAHCTTQERLGWLLSGPPAELLHVPVQLRPWIPRPLWVLGQSLQDVCPGRKQSCRLQPSSITLQPRGSLL